MSKHLFLGAVFAGAILATSACLAADGEPDPGFGSDGIAYLSIDGVEGHELRTGAVLALPDGKLLFGGSRNKLLDGNPDPHMRGTLARMNADGSVDASFGSDPANPGLVVLPDLVPGTGMQYVETVQRLADGSLLVAGSAEAFGPLTAFVLKLDAQGTPVTGFGSNGQVMLSNAYFHASALDGEQRLLLAGERYVSGRAQGIVVRLTHDGQFDTGFGSDGDGIVRFAGPGKDNSSYFASLAIDADGGVLVGGACETQGGGWGSDFSLARLDADGRRDPAFAGSGWRLFRLPDDASIVNGIDRLLTTPDGKIVIAAHHEDAKTGVNVVLGRLNADGSTDPSFGGAARPGYQLVDVVPDAWNRYPSGLVRQADGKLLVSVTYAIPGKSDFLAFRSTSEGALDPGFGNGGIVDFDLAPNGIYSDLTALTLQNGQPILAGSAKRAMFSPLVDIAVVRLGGRHRVDLRRRFRGWRRAGALSRAGFSVSRVGEGRGLASMKPRRALHCVTHPSPGREGVCVARRHRFFQHRGSTSHQVAGASRGG